MLVGTARTAAAGVPGLRVLALADPVLRLEGGAAPARRLDVRVVDREAGVHERVLVVDLRAEEVRRAERIDDDGDAVHLDLVVALLCAAVEAERVLEPGAAAALDRHAQHARLL